MLCGDSFGGAWFLGNAQRLLRKCSEDWSGSAFKRACAILGNKLPLEVVDDDASSNATLL
ncbi:MAG: hypothetical protein A3H59_02335 [Candidatus Jacksonbacteria bacterium RIFCSPLOWO2_02_FULL_43_9]|nr:MAG: hypothetical protein A3B94_03245 [Candidatus Jacksonbacteria bacterium RIFCSPHIGHO2_02_FULL_43_10]OGY71341.1 MAG: hypothetical protein A2986_03710 [Candidatus Jacksonbacteria bacterium RIFCSPLOWO2_01_FULL_44_13]OGY74342.1 MAG: hypothetical protein A3H59_02335 [Candidatus Jacksonbacteria bacterium RIFCSPLOWO2_02_FULL_43_9]